MTRIIGLFLLQCIIFPAVSFAAEPISTDGFIEITGHILNSFDALDDKARHDNFNQLENHDMFGMFDEVRSKIDEYEAVSSDSVYNWPEGQQKNIASKLKEIHFLYRAFSLSQHMDFRQKAEKDLVTVRKMFNEYVMNVRSETDISRE